MLHVQYAKFDEVNLLIRCKTETEIGEKMRRKCENLIEEFSLFDFQHF